MPLKNHVPIDQTEKIFWNEFVVKCGVTDMVNLRTYDDLKLKMMYLNTEIALIQISFVFDHIRT